MDIWSLSKEHSQHISNLLKEGGKNNEEGVLSSIYQYVKSISNLYYDGNSMHTYYDLIRSSVYWAEKGMRSKILDIPVAFELSEETNNDSFLDYLVYSTRKYLVEKGHWDISRIPFDTISFANECQNAANFVKKICDENGVESYIMLIAPGYDEKARLYGNDGLNFHYFNIVKIDGEYFLLDATYSQFFYTSHNVIDRTGLVNIPPCAPGYFMLLSEERANIAKQIIKSGYIKLDEETFKMYLDAFTISFRNGLYYESTDDFSFTTCYSVDDYISFFEGYDSQINKEGKENLGYQRRPLKKEINFKQRRHESTN